MKKVRAKDILGNSHSLMNETVIGTASVLEEAVFIIKIDDLLKERGMTQKDLADFTGMRNGTISELVNGKGISINKVQLLAIMAVLRVTNLHEIIEIRLPDPLAEAYEAESKQWKETREVPISVKEMAQETFMKRFES